MTNQEIKKAFERFKKELNKETGIKGGFTMNCKQIENRTATYAVCPAIDFDSKIADAEAWAAKASREDHKKICLETAEYFKALKAQYGTWEARAEEIIGKVTGSKAFETFSAAIGGVKWNTELGKDYCGQRWLYIRFNY